MSDTTAIAAIAPPSPDPATRAAAQRPLSEDVDLYAEGASFSEADWAGPGIDAVFGEDGFDFKDLLDIVNPLQHLPVVGTLYRAVTGDALEPGARILGGTLFGGVGGLVTAIANAVYENETGKDIGDTTLALFTGGDATDTAVAQAETAPTATATPDAAATPATAPRSAPSAASPLALAGHAPSPLPAAAGEAADPMAALLQAQAAVPGTQRPGATGLPATNFRGSLAVGENRAVPIRFKAGPAPATPPAQANKTEPPASAEPAPAAAGTAVSAKANAPRPLIAHAGPAAPTPAPRKPGPGATPSRPQPAPMADIALRMQDALDKYETLMKSRTAPSISNEI